MKIDLMPHQTEAMEWLINERKGCGILAHEPGCGKTLTTLETIRQLKKDKILIIAPASLLGTWKQEIDKWFPEWGTSTFVFRGTTAQKMKIAKQMVGLSDTRRIVIANYEAFRVKSAELLTNIKWDAIILDETAKIQNPRAKVTKAIMKLQAPARIALNGTLISNGWQDIWSVCEWIEKGSLYGNFYVFRNIHAKLHPMFPQIVGWRETEEIKRRTWPLISFKKKTEVLKDLPPCTEQDIFVPLSKEEEDLYEKIREELCIPLRDGKELEISNVLVELIRLRQCVNGLFTEEKSKIETLKELLASIPPEAKCIVFTGLAETARMLRDSFSPSPLLITGETPVEEREKILDIFKKNSDCPVLVGTEAMAFGLNIQEASYIINFDLPWSYAKYEQRIGRAWRKGQQHAVTVWNILAEGKIDVKMKKILDRKVAMADDFSGVTREDIRDILKL